MNRIYRKEYKKHLKNTLFPNLLWGIAFCLIMLSFSVAVLAVFVVPIDKNIRYVSSLCDHVIDSGMEYDNYSYEYRFIELMTIRNTRGEMLNVNTYMTRRNNAFFLGDYSDLLGSDEIIVSEKVADKLNVNLGDHIFIEYPILSEPHQYEIVAVIPYCWNYYDILSNSDFSVVHVGFDDYLLNNSSISIDYFLNDLEYEQFIEDSNAYSRHYDLKNEVSVLKTRIVMIQVVYIVVSLVISLLFLCIILRNIERENRKYFRKGFNVAIVKSFYRNDLLLFFGCPVMILLLLFLVMTLTSSLSYIVVIGSLFLDVVMGCVGYLRGVRVYGSAI